MKERSDSRKMNIPSRCCIPPLPENHRTSLTSGSVRIPLTYTFHLTPAHHPCAPLGGAPPAGSPISPGSSWIRPAPVIHGPLQVRPHPFPPPSPSPVVHRPGQADEFAA